MTSHTRFLMRLQILFSKNQKVMPHHEKKMDNPLFAFLDFIGVSMYWENLNSEDITFDSLGMFSQAELETLSIPKEAAELILKRTPDKPSDLMNRFLKHFGLEKNSDVLSNNGITLNNLESFSELQLVELGLSHVAARKIRRSCADSSQTVKMRKEILKNVKEGYFTNDGDFYTTK